MTPQATEIYLTDRSAAETDDLCGMRYWWNRKEGGKGIVSKVEEFPLLIGRETHEDLATIAKMADISPEAIQAAIDEIVSPLTEEDKQVQDKMEVLYRRLGWLAAFALFIEPKMRADYEDIGIEKEIILDRDPLWVAVTPDRVLKSRTDGSLVYKEYKTTISASPKWVQSWHFAIQLHVGLAAVQEELKQKVSFAQIVGLMKGYKSAVSSHLAHPYVWGYYNKSRNEWTHSYEKARSQGWEAMPVWEFPGGVVEWVLQCGEDTARSQFPHSPPVFLDANMLEDWVARRLHREKILRGVEVVSQANPRIRALFFEKRTRACRPPFGEACPYLACCWNAETGGNPLRSGEYVVRTPHHEVELVGVE